MKRKYWYFLLILLVTISTCKKDNNSPQVYTENSFPIAVGNWWQYQLLDMFGGGGYDTFTVTVVSTTNMPTYIQYNCNVVYNGAVWNSGYFLQSDSSLSFVNNIGSYYLFPNFHLKFPSETGYYWQGAFPGDSIMVVGEFNTYSSYGHTYGPCYSTREAYNLPHNFKVESMILTPKIGLINQVINFNSDTAGKTVSYGGGIQIQQSIVLINYHVQ